MSLYAHMLVAGGKVIKLPTYKGPCCIMEHHAMIVHDTAWKHRCWTDTTSCYKAPS